MLRVLSSVLVAEVAVGPSFVVIRTSIGTRCMHCAEAQRGLKACGLADASLTIQERDALTAELEGSNVLEPDRPAGTELHCAQMSEGG
jgi:hypothetical protein